MLDTPKPPLAVTADKAYDSEKVRQQIKDEGALPIIPSRCNATKKAYCPKRFYRRRHKIENYFCRIKDWRRIAARRYDTRHCLAAGPSGHSTGSGSDPSLKRLLAEFRRQQRRHNRANLCAGNASDHDRSWRGGRLFERK